MTGQLVELQPVADDRDHAALGSRSLIADELAGTRRALDRCTGGQFGMPRARPSCRSGCVGAARRAPPRTRHDRYRRRTRQRAPPSGRPGTTVRIVQPERDVAGQLGRVGGQVLRSTTDDRVRRTSALPVRARAGRAGVERPRELRFLAGDGLRMRPRFSTRCGYASAMTSIARARAVGHERLAPTPAAVHGGPPAAGCAAGHSPSPHCWEGRHRRSGT